ncbi:hypothetical protein FS749_011227 [Ceratobasidium sp. UAMH 11750]|nr:hypothetical protein FS749_011227 [Ceratobasidium sp. UAMH 11750]
MPKACLPAVLTSDLVAAALGDMYELGQHLIHMIAGPACLERYTSNQAHEAEEDHPHGIILMVLQDLLKGKTNSNYPVKIMNVMWVSRAMLLAELKAQRVAPASSVSARDYQTLINTSRPWWELLSLFKLRKLDRGLGLTVAKQFIEPRAPSISTSPAENAPPIQRSSIINSTSRLSPRSRHRAEHTRHTHVPTPRQQLTTPTHADTDDTPSSGGHTNKPQQSEVSDRESPSELPRKRRRVEQDHPEGEQSTVHTVDVPSSANIPASGNNSSHTITQPQNMFGPDAATTQLKHLEAIIPDLKPDEASALEGLLAHVSCLHKTSCMARVLSTVNEHLPVSNWLFQPRSANLLTVRW